jgi:hypothetical protein
MNVLRFLGNSILAGYSYVCNRNRFHDSPNSSNYLEANMNSTVLLIESKTAKKTRKILSRCRNPYSIRLKNCHIDLKCAIILKNILISNTQLRILYLYPNNIDVNAIEVIAEGISNNTSLFALRMENVYCDEDENNTVAKISKAIAVNKCIKTFEIYNYAITRDTAIAITSILKLNKTLTNLIMNENSLVTEDAVYIIDALVNNKTLLRLDISSNELCYDITYNIGIVLKYNTTLVSLDLSNNNIPSKGCINIARTLVNNSTLTSLSLLYNCNFDAECYYEFKNMLMNNLTVTTLHLYNTYSVGNFIMDIYKRHEILLVRNKKYIPYFNSIYTFRTLSGLPDELNIIITECLINYIRRKANINMKNN